VILTLLGLAKGLFGFLKGVNPLVLVILVLALWGWQGHHKARVTREARDIERAAAVIVADREKAKNDAETKRREIAAQGVTNALTKQIAIANSRSAADSGTIGRLRNAIAAAARRPVPGNPSPLSPGEATERLGIVAAGCVERLGQVVAASRRAAIAGAGCESQYDALTR